jgi:hypothetical protein
VASSFFASRQLSSNHGANVLPHLFGFFGVVSSIFLTTPAAVAYVNMYSSTAAALSSFVIVVSSTNALNCYKNTY